MTASCNPLEIWIFVITGYENDNKEVRESQHAQAGKETITVGATRWVEDDDRDYEFTLGERVKSGLEGSPKEDIGRVLHPTSPKRKLVWGRSGIFVPGILRLR